MNILLLGSGGRESAFAWKISQSELCTQLFIAPGNEQQAHQKNIETAFRFCDNSPCCKQQRISRKERGYHKSRFSKDDQKEYQIGPGLVFAYNFNQVSVNM